MTNRKMMNEQLEIWGKNLATPYLGLYRSDKNPKSFYIYAGIREDFGKTLYYSPFENLPEDAEKSLTLSAVKRVPRAWKDDIGWHITTKRGGLAPVGYIHYNEENDKVRSTTYYPRDSLEKGYAPRISYFLEAMIVHQLRLQGVTNIATSYDPSDERVAQIERVGLFPHASIEIKEWLKGMGRGIRERMEGSKPV